MSSKLNYNKIFTSIVEVYQGDHQNVALESIRLLTKKRLIEFLFFVNVNSDWLQVSESRLLNDIHSYLARIK